jgi:hypothetical protein
MIGPGETENYELTPLPAVVPACFGCSKPMAWRSHDIDDDYASEGSCGNCQRCGSNSENMGASRWFCEECQDNTCIKCASQADESSAIVNLTVEEVALPVNDDPTFSFMVSQIAATMPVASAATSIRAGKRSAPKAVTTMKSRAKKQNNCKAVKSDGPRAQNRNKTKVQEEEENDNKRASTASAPGKENEQNEKKGSKYSKESELPTSSQTFGMFLKALHATPTDHEEVSASKQDPDSSKLEVAEPERYQSKGSKPLKGPRKGTKAIKPNQAENLAAMTEPLSPILRKRTGGASLFSKPVATTGLTASNMVGAGPDASDDEGLGLATMVTTSTHVIAFSSKLMGKKHASKLSRALRDQNTGGLNAEKTNSDALCGEPLVEKKSECGNVVIALPSKAKKHKRNNKRVETNPFLDVSSCVPPKRATTNVFQDARQAPPKRSVTSISQPCGMVHVNGAAKKDVGLE